MAHLEADTLTMLSPSYHEQGERDDEAETYDPKRMRLMIQIIVFLEILTSCFLRSEEVWLT